MSRSAPAPFLKKVALPVILGVAFCARLSWLLINQPVPISDFAAYHHLATDLVEHGQLGYPHPSLDRLPGFPWLLSLMLRVSPHVVWLGFLNVLLGTALVGLVYLFAWRLVRKRGIALGAALLCALNPTFVFSSAILASEPLAAVCFMLAFLLVLVAAPCTGWHYWVGVSAAGLAIGLGMLTRGDLLFHVLALLALLWSMARTKAQATLASCVLLLAVAGSVAPWVARNASLGAGAQLSTTSGLNFYLAHNGTGYGWHSKGRDSLAKLGPKQRNSRGWALGWAHMRDTGLTGLAKAMSQGTYHLFVRPPRYALKYSTVSSREAATTQPSKLMRKLWLVLSAGFYYGLLILAGAGLFLARRLPKPALVATAGPMLMNWLTFAVVFWGKPRYRYVSELCMCVLAAVALHYLRQAYARRQASHRVATAADLG